MLKVSWKYLYILLSHLVTRHGDQPIVHCASDTLAKIQIDLSDDENRIVEMFKISNLLHTKQDAIKRMIQHFEAEIKPKKINEKEYFGKK